MKHFLILLMLIFTSLSAQAQFSQAIGSPDHDFRATQIRTLGGNTYVSGWLTDPNAIPVARSTEGILVRLNATGAIDWIYQLSSVTPATVINGTRIHDFDFDDAGANIVFVGATTPRDGQMLDSDCIVGMVDITTGAGVFQQSYGFRFDARESFQRIINNPSTDAVDADSYIISGLINDTTTGPIDNYISARAVINPNNPVNVVFDWIDENNINNPAFAFPDEELHRMRVLNVVGDLQVVYSGTSIPNRRARINFHDINNGVIINEYSFSSSGTAIEGTVHDVTQVGNTMIVVGRNRDTDRAFIASVNLLNFNVVSSLEFNNIDRFSRVIIEPTTGEILTVGERINDNPTICRFELNANLLVYNNARVLDFGTNSPGDGLLVTEGNEAFFADTRSMLATFGFNQSAAVFRTNLDFLSCNTEEPIFTPLTANLNLNLDPGINQTALMVPNFINLALEQDTLCAISLCGDGFSLDTLISVFHNSRSHYVEVADINNDGWNDFAVPEIRFGNTPRFSISMNNQNLSFANIPSSLNNPPFFGDAESMQFIDLDGGTGDLDIVVQRQGRIEVFIENGTGAYTLTQAFDVTVATPPFAGNTLGLFRSDFDLVHYNIDPFEDLVVTGASTGGGQEDRIAVFTGTGNPNSPFITTPLVTMEGLPAIKYWETVHVDIDPAQGNGNDLLIGQAGFNAGQQSIFGYLNTGINNAPFNATPDLNYETPAGFIWPRGMEMIDIENNGQLDLIVSMQAANLNGGVPNGEGALIISRDVQTAAGSYTTANLQWEIINIPGQPVGIAIDDIDGDGDNDIAVAVHNGTVTPSFVRIYENNGNGNFFNFIDVITPIGQTVELEIADFNNDCCLDIVTTQWNGNMSYVLINDCQATEFTIRGQVVCENDPCDFLQTPNGVPNQTVQVSDGNNIYTAITNANGEYEVDVPAALYTISVANVNYGDATCLNANTADVINYQPVNNPIDVNFIIENNCNLDVNMIGGLSGFAGANTCPFVATPCDSLIWEYCFEIENNTCNDQVIDEISINLPHGISIGTVTVNQLVDCVSQTPVASTVPTVTTLTGLPLFGSTVNYNLNSSVTIMSGECFTACVEATFEGGFTLPVTAEIDVQFSCDGAPSTPATSGVAYQDTCSCDPNLKLAYFPQNCGTLDELLNQPIEYTIQFTNIGQTAAYDIRVLDQLDNNLDWSTFQWLGSSHPSSSISMTNGLLDVFFNNINLAPSANGWLRFSVKPDGSTPNGTSIYNSADIIFDNNAHVSTNTTETIIQASTAQADLQFNATEFCVGDQIVIDYTWTGDAAWVNYTQNGTSIGQNVAAPSSGSQVVFTIPDNSYVGLWEYELIAYDSITGCADTASVVINIYDCECDFDDQIFMTVNGTSYQFYSNLFDPVLNPGWNITYFKWHLGDGTISTDQSPIHQYNCKKFGPHTVVVCLYYEAELNGQICEGEICQEFEVCKKGKGKNSKSNIFPNPASSEITIQSEVLLSQTDVLTVETYTIEGKLLKTYEVRSDHEHISIKMSNHYLGLVYLRILNNSGEVLLEDRFLKLKNRTD